MTRQNNIKHYQIGASTKKNLSKRRVNFQKIPKNHTIQIARKIYINIKKIINHNHQNQNLCSQLCLIKILKIYKFIRKENIFQIIRIG